jgi:hypothetical protein
MPRKRDTSSERLGRHVEIETNRLAHAFGLAHNSKTLGSAYEAARKYEASDWTNIKTRSAAAHHALSIDANDRPLKKAFAAFNLDDRNPFNWRKLIFYMADAHFGSKQVRPGPRKRWSDCQLCEVLWDFDQTNSRYRRAPGSKVSELRICEWPAPGSVDTRLS